MVAKVYSEDQKYNGINDSSFDYALQIFTDTCQRSGLPPEGYMTAFPVMLRGLALAHYHNSHLS
jgi:hypothetical protein